jgi:hypothetical protein
MWLDETLDALARQPLIGYADGGAPASEPTAIAALALARHDRLVEAKKAATFLAEIQSADGSVGVRPGEPTPGWPTSLAVVAWSVVGNALRGVPSAAQNGESHTERHRGRSLQDNPFQLNIDRGVAWLLSVQGTKLEQSEVFGHDMQLAGWAWAEGTHSWLEPTALAVLALKAAGQSTHVRTREAVRLILDRQLPGGGCNYGNTVVLGQRLRPHVQPTGVALLALAGEKDSGGRIAKSIAWLRRSIGPETTAPSLAWAVLGLKAHDTAPPQADEWLAQAAGTLRVPSPHALALLALAAKGWPA